MKPAAIPLPTEANIRDADLLAELDSARGKPEFTDLLRYLAAEAASPRQRAGNTAILKPATRRPTHPRPGFARTTFQIRTRRPVPPHDAR